MNTSLSTDTPSQAAHSGTKSHKTCRFCAAELRTTFVDLGLSPLCETYPSADDLNHGETFYPLHVYVCSKCFLVQLEEFESAENIFSDYAYFSSYSDSWLKHSKNYCEKMISRFGFNEKSFVVEVASNDGYLLQYFVEKKVPVLGIEPAANVAKVAVEKGVPTLVKFFGTELAEQLAAEGQQADLVLGNNVLAQVPDLNSFVEGLKILLKPEGVVTLEFPHLLRLIERNEFDTIYHEHFSYFSMLTVARIFEAHGLKAFDVEELASHGGCGVYGCRTESRTHTVQPAVAELIRQEEEAGQASLAGYEGFARQVRETKWALVEFLLKARQEGKSVAGYGAPGKSATLLQYCGIGRDLLEYTVDRSPYKQGPLHAGHAYSDLPSGPDSRDQARLCADSALESEGREFVKVSWQYIREWGRPLCRADSGGRRLLKRAGRKQR